MAVDSTFPAPLLAKNGWPWEAPVLHEGHSLGDKHPYPKISIITPSLNQGDFIEECIRSVLLQQYPNLEYIIIDGGSQDNTVNIIKKYEPWIDYWVSEEDSGQSQAINKGMKIATGDIVAWLNSDDMYFPGVFFEIARQFSIYSNKLLCVGDCEFVTSEETFIWKSKIPSLYKLLLHPYLHVVEKKSIHMPPQPSVFIASSLYKKNGKLDENLYYGMDYDLWLRLLINDAKFVYVSKVFSRYKIHDKSKSGSGFDCFLPEWKKVSCGHIGRLPLTKRIVFEFVKFSVIAKVFATIFARKMKK